MHKISLLISSCFHEFFAAASFSLPYFVFIWKPRKKGYYKRTFDCICFCSNVGCGSYFFPFRIFYMLPSYESKTKISLTLHFFHQIFFVLALPNFVCYFEEINEMKKQKFTTCDYEGKFVIVILRYICLTALRTLTCFDSLIN